jgi:phage terminase small subunit
MARRRLAPHEVAQLSPGERAKWYRRHKLTPPAEPVKLRPPDWLSARHKALWQETVAATPPALLQPIDRGLLSAYVVELALLEDVATSEAPDKAKHMRSISSTLAQLAGGLCLTPVLRARLALDTPPPAPVETGPDRWAELRRWPVIDGDKRR